jgi:hypothetical protein
VMDDRVSWRRPDEGGERTCHLLRSELAAPVVSMPPTRKAVDAWSAGIEKEG